MNRREARAKHQDAFNQFYQNYPRKTDSTRALDEFLSLIERGVDPQLLIEKATAFSRNVDPAQLQYVPSPRTWLRDERWTDADLFTDQHTSLREWLLDKYYRGDAQAVQTRFGFIYSHPPLPDELEDVQQWHMDQRKIWIGQVAQHILHGKPPPD